MRGGLQVANTGGASVAGPALHVSAGSSRPRRRARPGSSIVYSLFVAPALVLSIAIVLVPGCLTFVYAFADWDGATEPYWIGLDNFRDLLGDRILWQGIGNNLTWLAIFLTVPMGLALLAASILLRKKRSHAIYQLILLIPFVLSPVVNVTIWKNMIFNPISGLTGFLGLGNPVADPATALATVAGVDIWAFWGYLTVVFFAAMRLTPADQLEAALIEGATGWQVFRHVTLPNIAPTIATMAVLVTIFSFRAFDYVYLMTGGGPARATELLSTLSYDFAFRTFEVGKAATVAVFITFFGFIASSVYVWLSRESVKR